MILSMQLRQRLIARGLFRKRAPLPLVGRQTSGSGFAREAVELRNPLSEDHVALRPSLMPGLIAALARNIRAGAKSVRLFEVGRVFLPPEAGRSCRLGLLLSGDAEGRAHWRGVERRQLDFFDLKGAIGSARSAGEASPASCWKARVRPRRGNSLR